MIKYSYRIFTSFLGNSSGLNTVFGFTISGFLLWMLIRSSGIELRDIHPDPAQMIDFALAVISFIIATWVQSVRARLFWTHIGADASEVKTYGSLVVGNFYNCLLPGNMGEGVRALLFSRANHVTLLNSSAAMIAEKWLNAQLFLILSICILSIHPFSGGVISYSILSTISIIMILLIFYRFMIRSRSFEKCCWRYILMLPRVGKVAFKLYKYTIGHLRDIRLNRGLLKYAFHSLLITILNITQFLLLLKAAGVPGPVGYLYGACLTAVSMIIIAFVPSAPSSVGVMHYGLYAVLVLASHQYGIAPDRESLQSFALYGIYVHLSYLLPELCIGFICLIRYGPQLFRIGDQ